MWEVTLVGGYKCSHKSTHRQPETHPHQRPSEGTSATIHRSSDVWIGLSIHQSVDSSERYPYIEAPIYVVAI